MKVLVTGGSGLLGSAVLRELRAIQPDAVLRVLDMVPPKAFADEFVAGDVLQASLVEQAAKGCTHVVHLAAALGVGQTEADKDACMQVNYQGTRNVLRAAHCTSAEHLVFASSSEIYGEQNSQPISENATPRPLSIYASSKLMGEAAVREYRAALGYRWRIVRFFNVYGPGQRRDFVISRFADAIKRLESPKLYGPGTQVRCFCFAADAARGLAQALLTKKDADEVFNIGNNAEPISITALAQRMIRLSNRRLSPIHVPFTESDRAEARETFSRIPDVSRAQAVLGFRAQIPLEQGLRAVLAHEGLIKHSSKPQQRPAVNA
jgi:nucleoside-diphosphate-sugar epimerase